MSAVRGLGDSLEEGLCQTARPAVPEADRREDTRGAGPRFAHVHRPGFADDFSDPLAAMQAVDEEPLAARGQPADAEFPKLAVAKFVGGLAGLERPDSGVDEVGSGRGLLLDAIAGPCNATRALHGIPFNDDGKGFVPPPRL